ncbi:hypothetical protein GCM10011378_33720 [Hymenobacter glacieicola]|uniref:Uncharacterized protein n=1 Tax=Hymenobacter glacieicola TaxID=1562124 RepID=A0ABQ1X160_9BACT|nr:hypothetical protein GCM10011378_33720 [Hymenobacter glacieicola]
MKLQAKQVWGKMHTSKRAVCGPKVKIFWRGNWVETPLPSSLAGWGWLSEWRSGPVTSGSAAGC